MNKLAPFLVFVLLILTTGSLLSSNASRDEGQSLSDISASQETPNLPGVFKFISYNVQGAVFDEWRYKIVQENAEIMLLVETGRWKISDGSFNEAVNEINLLFPDETPYEGVSFEPDGTTDGQAFFSRYPIMESYTLLSYQLDDGSFHTFNHEVLYAKINIEGTEVAVVGVHLSCCSEFVEVRGLEQEAIINFLDSLGNLPIIYAGDLNSHAMEVYEQDPEVANLGTRPAEMLFNSSHPKASQIHTFHDVYRELNPDFYQYPGYSYYDDQYISRIDYIIVNQYLLDALVSSTTEAVQRDHALINAILNLNHETLDLRPPLPPVGITVDVDVANVKSTISWTANTEPDLFKYQLWRNKCLLTELPVSTTNYVDDYFYQLNKTYNYELRAVDIHNNTSPLSGYNFINSSYGNLERPGQPIVFASTTSGGIRVTWDKPYDGHTSIIRYDIYRTPSATQSGFPVASVYAENYTDTAIARSGIKLYYQVRAFNFVGGGWLSARDDAVSGFASNDLTSQIINNVLSPIRSEQDDTGNCPVTEEILVYTPPTSSSSTSLSSSNTSSGTSKTSDSSDGIFLLIVVVYHKKKQAKSHRFS